MATKACFLGPFAWNNLFNPNPEMMSVVVCFLDSAAGSCVLNPFCQSMSFCWGGIRGKDMNRVVGSGTTLEDPHPVGCFRGVWWVGLIGLTQKV